MDNNKRWHQIPSRRREIDDAIPLYPIETRNDPLINH